MKRDMDAVRRIVLALRDASEPFSGLEGMEKEVFLANAQLILEAGLATGSTLPPNTKQIPSEVVLLRLTWEGQDFADSIKDESVWDKAKRNVIKPTASWSFSILKEYLKLEIRRSIPGFKELF